MNLIQNTGRAAVIALALAATAIPAQAAGFSFSFGNDVFPHRTRLCIPTDAGLRNAIKAQGYRNIYLNVENDGRIQSRATRGDWVYLLTVNSCTGRILDRQRLRHS